MSHARMRDMGNRRLAGKVGLITGAGRGMGRAHAELLASQGAEIIVQDIDPKLAETTVETIENSGGKASVLMGDVADAAVLATRIAEAERAAGRIDVLVNNAGI